MSFLATITNDGTLFTLGIGFLLVSGVLAFGWYDYRRTVRLPHLGTVMVKNRLKNSA